MLFVIFSIDNENYALPASGIVEVLPLLPLSRFHAMPAGLAGAFAYHGHYIPAIDLSQLLLGRPGVRCMSTRLIVIRLSDDGGEERLAGLIAENATDILRCEPAAFQPFAKHSQRGLIQRAKIDELVPAQVRAACKNMPVAAS